MINSSQMNSIDEVIKEMRRPNVSETNPQNGEVIVMAINTEVVRAKVPPSDTSQELHSKAGVKMDSIIISIASVKNTHPAARESSS